MDEPGRRGSVLDALMARRGQAIGCAILAAIWLAWFFGGRLIAMIAWTCGSCGAAFVSWYRMRNPVNFRSRDGVLGWFLNLSRYRKLSADRVVTMSQIELAMFSVFAVLGCVAILTAV